MNPEQIRRKWQALLLEEAAHPERMTYWVSFADTERNLGVVCVVADGPSAAIQECTIQGLNPGGSVRVYQAFDTVRDEDLNRLLDRSYVEHEMRPKEET